MPSIKAWAYTPEKDFFMTEVPVTLLQQIRENIELLAKRFSREVDGVEFDSLEADEKIQICSSLEAALIGSLLEKENPEEEADKAIEELKNREKGG